MTEAATRPDDRDDEPVLLRHDDAGVTTLTLNRPRSGNSLSHALVGELRGALAAIAEDAAVRVVVLAAAGRHFCTGHDLEESLATNDPEQKRDSNIACNELMLALVDLPKPVIARVHGTATASGLELMASCDLAIAADGARFATPGVNIGMWCLTPQVALSRTVARKHAMEMLLTGRLFDADSALGFGLINRVVPAAELDEAVGELAREIASKSSFTLALGKQSFYRQAEMHRRQAYDYVADAVVRNFCAADVGEGISAFLEKRPPRWRDR